VDAGADRRQDGHEGADAGGHLPYVPRRPGSLPPELAVRKTTAPITFVTKRDCPLCVTAKKAVDHAARRYKLAVEVVDLEAQPADIQEKLKFSVPVVIVDGKRRFSGHVSAPLLEKILATRPQ
jgi:glutaredoxin